MTTLRELFSRRFFGATGARGATSMQPSDAISMPGSVDPSPPPPNGGAGDACCPSPPAAAATSTCPATAIDASPTRKHRRLDAGPSLCQTASRDSSPTPAPHGDKARVGEAHHTDALWRAPRRSSRETVCHIYAHMWFRMARTHQQASDTYVVLDPIEWQRALHSTVRTAPDAFPATLVLGVGGGMRARTALGTRHCDAHDVGGPHEDTAVRALFDVAVADDDDRWVPALLSAAGRRTKANCNAVCRSNDFATSLDAVYALMLRLYDAHDVLDAATWLIALVLAERIYLRHQHRMARASAATGDAGQAGAFRLYRGHELRHLFTLFTLTVKLTSDYCFHLRFLHNLLPSLITRIQLVPLNGGVAPRSLLPDYLKTKYPLIAQRVEQSVQAEYAGIGSFSSRPPTSPPFCLRSAANAEGSMLRFGLGYHGLVLWGDALQLMDVYCSEGERRTLVDAFRATKGQ